MKNGIQWVHDPISSLVGTFRKCGVVIDCYCKKTTLEIGPPKPSPEIDPEKD